MDNFTWNSNYHLIVDCRGLLEYVIILVGVTTEIYSYILLMSYVFRLVQKLVNTSDVCSFTV